MINETEKSALCSKVEQEEKKPTTLSVYMLQGVITEYFVVAVMRTDDRN
jgi:hypothetical protein